MFSIFKKKPAHIKFVKEVERQIKSYGYDKDNWDGQDAKSVSFDTIRLIKGFFEYVNFECPLPCIYGGIDGSIAIHFTTHHDKLWVIFLPDYKIHYFYDIPGLGRKEEIIKSTNRVVILNLKIAMNFLFHHKFEAFH